MKQAFLSSSSSREGKKGTLKNVVDGNVENQIIGANLDSVRSI